MHHDCISKNSHPLRELLTKKTSGILTICVLMISMQHHLSERERISQVSCHWIDRVLVVFGLIVNACSLTVTPTLPGSQTPGTTVYLST